MTLRGCDCPDVLHTQKLEIAMAFSPADLRPAESRFNALRPTGFYFEFPECRYRGSADEHR